MPTITRQQLRDAIWAGIDAANGGLPIAAIDRLQRYARDAKTVTSGSFRTCPMTQVGVTDSDAYDTEWAKNLGLATGAVGNFAYAYDDAILDATKGQPGNGHQIAVVG